jgi:surfactin synthase thioesterase subunit
MTHTTLAEHRATSSPLGCHRPQLTARVRLVAFSHAGGRPLRFVPWALELAPAIELWHVTLPGRGARWREPFARTWPPVVDATAAAILREVSAPVALFGHSLGALLAFEVARELTRTGLPPVHLIVSGRGAPDSAPSLDVPETDQELLRNADLVYGGVPEQVRTAPDVLAHFLPILRADLELARAYAPTSDTTLTCPITAMTGEADPIAPPSALKGWGRQTTGNSELHVLPGGHFAVVDHEPVALGLIGRCLAA